MNGSDHRPQPEWPIRSDSPESRLAVAAIAGNRRSRAVSPVAIALGGLVLLLLALWLLAGSRNSDQDKLTNDSASTTSATDPEKLCSSSKTYDLIKRDLFRRAAQLRGSDQAAFDRLAAYAAIRMENPVMESEGEGKGSANCSGSLSLDLPPGVGVVGGRRTLAADVEYSMRPAADGTGSVVLLRNADAIIAPLATLARTGQPVQRAPAAPANVDSTAQPSQPTPAPSVTVPTTQAPPRVPAEPAPATQRASTARPSFNCGNARTRGEIAVCSDSGLASLDRQMASQFGRAASSANSAQRALLERTRSRFLRYRDSCQSEACIADSYRGRIREIRDIMEGRWQPER